MSNSNNVTFIDVLLKTSIVSIVFYICGFAAFLVSPIVGIVAIGGGFTLNYIIACSEYRKKNK